MKAFWFAVLFVAAFTVAARAQSQADDRYIGIYGLIQRADQLSQTGEAGEALAVYSDALAQLQRFQKVYPGWNPPIVNFRLSQLSGKIAELKPFAAPKSVPAAVPAASVAELSEADLAKQQLETLRGQIEDERAQNRQLQAKLKEALAVRPAPVDATELARSQEKVRQLMKQNDLLIASRSASAKVETIYVTNVTQIFLTNVVPPRTVSSGNPMVVSNLADVFNRNQRTVVVTNYIRTVVVDTNAMEMLKLERAAAVKNFNTEHQRAEQLADQLDKLKRSGVAAVPAVTNAPAGNSTELLALRAENADLRNQIVRLRTAADAANATSAATSAQLKQALAQVTALKSEKEVLELERTALQGKLKSLAASTNAAPNTAAFEARIRELTLERNDLIERLDVANKQKSGKNSETLAQLSSVNQEVAMLRSRLATVEAQPVPFTAEELALFRKNTPAPVNPDANKKSIKQMPAGTAELVASASRHFARREYDQAEADYQKILDRDQNNGIALANLATIELQQGKLADAEAHIQAALGQSPDDPYNLSTMGFLKFRREKYNDALNYLSRAAQVDPNNPEIQNYLGLTLSELGQRKPAEAALRRAIQLAPGYAPAHNNLAVIYLTQTPPLPELARWHYQKALEAGQPRNTDLEKMLSEKGAPVQ